MKSKVNIIVSAIVLLLCVSLFFQGYFTSPLSQVVTEQAHTTLLTDGTPCWDHCPNPTPPNENSKRSGPDTNGANEDSSKEEAQDDTEPSKNIVKQLLLKALLNSNKAASYSVAFLSSYCTDIPTPPPRILS